MYVCRLLLTQCCGSSQRLPNATCGRSDWLIGKSKIHHYSGSGPGVLAGPCTGTIKASHCIHDTVQTIPVQSHAVWFAWSACHIPEGLLAGCSGFAAAYLDDVVIDWGDHIFHIHSILGKLREAGLTMKCQFAMYQCAYLGHVVGNGEIRPDKSKIQAVENFLTPATKRQVRASLGLTGYNMKFIANYAELTADLTDLTKKDVPSCVRWTAACEKAFQALKDKLCSAPVLRSPNFDKQFILQSPTQSLPLVGSYYQGKYAILLLRKNTWLSR